MALSKSFFQKRELRMPVEIVTLTGEALKRTLDSLAQVRISVFRDWPYLYEGSLDYEAEYLQRYAEADGAVVVAAYDGGKLIGAATGAPLGEELEEFRTPFEAQGYDPKVIFYLAESVLQPAYRGQGLGHRFFDAREAHAKRLGFRQAAFCAVVRPENHPLKPAEYRPLDGFWQKRGYKKLDGITVNFPWTDIGEKEESKKVMQVWFRNL
jgi:GNAT superfamily N-acetyltransferase